MNEQIPDEFWHNVKNESFKMMIYQMFRAEKAEAVTKWILAGDR